MIALLFLALGLAMDAFAVSLVRGASGKRSFVRALETGMAFGLAQAVMPLAGWALGALFTGYLEAFDHWIAFGILTFLGGRMIREARHEGEVGAEEAERESHGHYWGLLLAAVATSIDAAAAGLTLGLFALPVWLSCVIIGGVTAGLCVPAYWLAARLGQRIGASAEIAGGLVLIGLGVMILYEHLCQ